MNGYIVNIMTAGRQEAVDAFGPRGGHGAHSAEAIGLMSRRRLLRIKNKGHQPFTKG